MENRSEAERPWILITNDDGVGSVLLESMVVRLSAKFNCVVAVPEKEYSFCGRKITQDKAIPVRELTNWCCRAWALDGSPVDCVNIALAHLVPVPVSLVLSGSNIGRNCGQWTVLSSGTVAGALEGALYGVPGLAVSQSVDGLDALRELKRSDAVPTAFAAVWERSLEWIEHCVANILAEAWPTADLGIWNINLPHHYAADARPESHRLPESPLAQIRYGSVFAPENDGTAYRYAHAQPRRLDAPGQADIDRITAGYPSRTWLRA